MTINIVFIGPFGWQPKATMRTRALWLGQALVARGHRVTMLLPPWDDPGRAGQVWSEGGVRVVNVTLPVGLPLLFHTLLTRMLVNQALALRPDVIHFFKPKAYAGLAHWALWWRRRLGGPSKRSIRLVLDSDDWEQAWNEVAPYSAAQKRFFTWQEQWGLSHADAITVASRELVRLAAPYAGSTPVAYIPNGWSRTAHATFLNGVTDIDTTAITQARQRWCLGDGPVILLYTRFVEFRLARIVTLVKTVAAQVPAARWLVVGAGLQGEERRLASRLQEAGLAKFVRFAGWLPPEEVPLCFRLADIAIYPYDDTLLNRTKCAVKLIDLLLAGLPVVADAVGQNSDYIRPGQSGLLVPPENDAAFGQAIVDLLQSQEKRQSLGRAATAHIKANFAWSKLAQTVEEVYTC